MSNSARLVPLHRNESYWLVDRELADACTELSSRDLATYPDYAALRKTVANYAQVTEQEIALTPGSDDAIDVIFQMCARRSLRALIPLPTFSMYEICAKRHGVAFTPVYYREEGSTFAFPTEETIRLMESGEIDIVFLCQPSNPLGSRIPKEEYDRIVATAASAHAIVIADEAYAEFCDIHTTSFEREHVIILRTFSKSFGLAGIRVGYAISSPAHIQELFSYLLPWPIAHPSVVIALSALTLHERFALRRSILINEREVFRHALSAIDDVFVFHSEANFLLCRVPDATSVVNHMLSDGIQVALGEPMTLDDTARKLLYSTIRMSIPAPEDRVRVVESIRAALDNS